MSTWRKQHMSSYRIWHRLYCRWYDAQYGGHPRTAAVWGWLADRVVHATDAWYRATA